MLLLIFKSAIQSSQTASSLPQRPLLAPGLSPIQRRCVSSPTLVFAWSCVPPRLALHPAPQGLELLEAGELIATQVQVYMLYICCRCRCCSSSIRTLPNIFKHQVPSLKSHCLPRDCHPFTGGAYPLQPQCLYRGAFRQG